MILKPNGSPSAEKGATPLEKEQQEPRRGGVKGARGWLGRTKKFGGREARNQDMYGGKGAAWGLPVEGDSPLSYLGRDLSASVSPRVPPSKGS